MEANELRIGNLVYSTFPKTEHIITGFCIQFLDEGGDPYVFEPIPLTEEWLLMFGFEFSESNDYYQFYDLDNFRIFLGIKVTQSVFITWKDCQIESSINNLSVHQLQNIYFSLTGTELKLKL